MAIFFNNNNNNPFLQLQSQRKIQSQPENVIEKEVDKTSKEQAKNVKQQTAPKLGSVGTGSWNTQAIQDAGLKVPSEYFIGVYTNYYRFNPDTISQDFPGANIQNPTDLKKAIDAKQAESAPATEPIPTPRHTELTPTPTPHAPVPEPETIQVEDISTAEINREPELSEEELKQEILAFLQELDITEINGFGRIVNKEQYRKLEYYEELLKDKDCYPNLKLEIEFTKMYKFNISLYDKDECVYNADNMYMLTDRHILPHNFLQKESTLNSENSPIFEIIYTESPVETEEQENLGQSFKTYTDLVHYIFGDAGSDFNKIYSDILFKGGCKEAENVALFHKTDFHAVTKLKVLEELHEEYLRFSSKKADDVSIKVIAPEVTTFETYSELVNYVHAKAKEDFSNKYPGIHFKGGCQAAANVAANHSTDFNNVTKLKVLEELYDEYVKLYIAVDTNSLFGDKNEIYPTDLSERLDEFIQSENNGVARFGELLKAVTEKFSITNFYDETELFKNIIKLLNDSVGSENTKPIKLTKDTFAKLNNEMFFKNLEKIINSNELKDEYYYGVDDELDLFSQAKTSGACWAIGTITTLFNNPISAQVVKDAMQFNDDGSVTVTFKGAGNRSYTITKEEMLYAKTENHSDGFSYGDNTMLVLLLATENLRLDLGKENKSSAISAGFKEGDLGYGIYGGYPDEMVTWLMGDSAKKVDPSSWDSLLTPNQRQYMSYLYNIHKDEKYRECVNQITSANKDIWMKAISSGSVIMTVSLFNKKDGHNFKTADGGIYSVNPPVGHTFSVIRAEGDTITLWDNYNQKEYTIYYNDLINDTHNELDYYIVDNSFYDNVVLPDELKNLPEISRDKESMIETITVNGQEYNVEKVLNSDEPVLINFEDISYYSVSEKEKYSKFGINNLNILDKLTNILKEDLLNITYLCPNYTDYEQLENVYQFFDTHVKSGLQIHFKKSEYVVISNDMKENPLDIFKNNPKCYLLVRYDDNGKINISINIQSFIKDVLELLPE